LLLSWLRNREPEGLGPDSAASGVPLVQAQGRWLRIAFGAGAITDALALVPMLSPTMARLLWGFEHPTGGYFFAMGYGASLMFGWTVLLLWAYQRPLERRFVACLTLLVIAGLVITEVVLVVRGEMALARMLPTWAIQAVLVGLFGKGYFGLGPASSR
jgi:uncharacterized membrane protein